MNISIKRIYEKPQPSDGVRILVDRLWPRGVTKIAAKIDYWLKAIAPSSELRRWFGHDPQKMAEFKQAYFAELQANHEAVATLAGYLNKGKVTLVYAAKDRRCNHALVLKDYLTNALK